MRSKIIIQNSVVRSVFLLFLVWLTNGITMGTQCNISVFSMIVHKN